ncbi:MAG: protein kinase [Kofleriaceae bacterium]
MTRYELLDRIGVGGMAEIFRGKAVAAGGFQKPVAIKRILPHLSQDRRFVQLLIAEAKVLSLLKHRNIVQIFDVGLGDDNQYFLVMEYVDGKDIGSVQRMLEQRRARLPFDVALHIGAEICEALEHAVTSRGPDGKPMGLVHRDVSPSNVLVSRAGEVKLTDFGIAKRAESDATRGGAVRGKFAYISPEQARNEQLDPRSDVFSVGILMWELICGRRLFSNLGDLEALRAVRDPIVPRPTEIDPRLPRQIDDVLLQALMKDKTKRHGGPGSFGEKLRALRYSLDSTVGDPSNELAKIIDQTIAMDRESVPPQRISSIPEFDGSEATVIRIHTADAFSARDSGTAAREVIDRFDDEETRLAQLSPDNMRILREASRDSSEAPAATVNRKHPRPGSDEATRMRPLGDFDGGFGEESQDSDARTQGGFGDDPPTTLPVTPIGGNSTSFGQNDETRLFQPRARQNTPRPQLQRDPPSRTAPPPVPAVQSTRHGKLAAKPTAPPPGSGMTTGAATLARDNMMGVPDDSGETRALGGRGTPGPEISQSVSQPTSARYPSQSQSYPSQSQSYPSQSQSYPQQSQSYPAQQHTPTPSPISSSMSQPSVAQHAGVPSQSHPAQQQNIPGGTARGAGIPAQTPAPIPQQPPVLAQMQPQQPMPHAIPSPAPGMMRMANPGWGPPSALQMPMPQPQPAPPQERPVYPRNAAPGSSQQKKAPSRMLFKPWMLVVGAILVAILAFVITRAFIG